MAAKKEKVIHTSGKRKRSIARAKLMEGKGVVRVNSFLLDNLQPDLYRLRIQEPLILAGDTSNKVDISIRIIKPFLKKTNLLHEGYKNSNPELRICLRSTKPNTTRMLQTFLDDLMAP